MGCPAVFLPARHKVLRVRSTRSTSHVAQIRTIHRQHDRHRNSFHLIGFDQRGAVVWQLKCSRAQLERRLVNIPSCLIGMEACSGAHYIGRQLTALGHDVRLIPAREAVPQGAQERLPRCRGDCGSGAAADHALCGDQDTGTDGPARSASRALAPCGPTDRPDQSDPRLSDRARHHGAARRRPSGAAPAHDDRR